jgi:hypothetical protein
MGWWSCDILGGDEPLDDLYLYEQKLGINELYPLHMWDDKKRTRIKKAIERDLQGYHDLANSENDVMMQVGAVVLMAAGAIMLPAFKKDAIKAGEADTWAKEDKEHSEDSERIQHIDAYIDLVKNYDETPIEYTSKGLMEQMLG